MNEEKPPCAYERKPRKNRRRISIKVKDGKVFVYAHESTSESEILRVLEKHREWTEKKLTASVAACSNIWVFGVPYTVEERDGAKAEIFLEDGRAVFVRAKGGAAERKRAEAEFYTAVLRPYIAERVEYWSSRTGIYPKAAGIKPLKRVWGRYFVRTGGIEFSSNLCKCEKDAIDYVVLHEFCHAWESGHGKKFYKRVEKFMPDWKERRKKLRYAEYHLFGRKK